MNNELTVRIQVPADIIMLRPLDLFVRNLVLQHPTFARVEGLIDDMELAFSEAFTNICRHAYKSGPEGLVVIEINVGQEQLEFRFEDNGDTFDPSKVEHPNLERPGEGGLGIWLIRQVMDEYLYHREKDGRNVLRLIKRISNTNGDEEQDQGRA